MYTVSSKTKTINVSKTIGKKAYICTLTLSSSNNGDYSFSNFRATLNDNSYSHDEAVNQNVNIRFNSSLSDEDRNIIYAEIATIKSDLLANLKDNIALPVLPEPENIVPDTQA